MAELKTKPTSASVTDFLNTVADEQKRTDSFRLLEMIRAQTGVEPKLWGDSIVGFGDSHYKYASGREGDWFWVGFSPRKQNLTLYFSSDLTKYNDLLSVLGKYTTGKGCLYIKRLSDVDEATLLAMIQRVAQENQSSA